MKTMDRSFKNIKIKTKNKPDTYNYGNIFCK